MNALAIPQTDLSEYAGLPEACRRELHRLLRSLDRIAKAPRGTVGAAIAAEARALDLSGKRLRTLWDLYRHTGHDWRVLVDRRKFRAEREDGLRKQDIALLQTYCERNQRKSAPAVRAFLRDWRAGVIRTDTPIDPRTGLPRGWSKRNLMRHRPKDSELAAMRQGLGAAIARHIGKVITTRAGLYVGSHYLADDVKRDFQVLLIAGTGGKEACIGELGVLDLYSAHRFAVHRRPIYTDSGIKDSFKEREMRFLVAAVLRNTGYSPRGTAWVVEHGTAAIREPLANFLRGVSNGLIDVKEPGFIGKAQAIPGLLGSGGGNPRHKARLETHHNLIHNEAGALIAATGHDRNPPEWLFGFERETKAVIKWMQSLSGEQAGLLRAPMLEYWQAVQILCALDQAIAENHEHELEGWAACGHTTIEYRPDITRDEWLSQQEFLALPELQQQRLLSVIEITPPGVVVRPRKLSRVEAWSRGAGELIRLPDHVIALMFADNQLGEDLRQARRLNAEGEFVITASVAEPDPMQFRGEVLTPAGEILPLDASVTYGIVLNPFDPARLWIYDPVGRYVGTAPRRVRPTYGDDEAIRLQLGQRSHDIAALTGPLKERHAGVSRALIEIGEHNRRVASGRTTTDADRDADQIARRAARFGTLVPAVPSVPPQPTTVEDFEEVAAGNSTHQPDQPTEQW